MNFPRRVRVVVALGAVLCMPLVACGSNNQSSTPATTASAPVGLQKFYSQTVQWGPCKNFGKSDSDSFQPSPNVQCAGVTVPIDYANPGGPTARIAMARVKATGTKVGSLFLNPGGPGGEGLWMAADVAGGTPIAEHFDRIGFDPRGVGASLPAIACQTPQQVDASRQRPDWDNSPAGIARQEQEHRNYAAGCQKITDGGDNMLRHLGTREVVQDLDIMRAVVGDPKLTYLGYSYGTRIGWSYAEKFPRNIRAMVIDGVVDPDANPAQESLAQSAGFQKVFDDFATQCSALPNCPLGQQPAQASAVFRALTVPLEGHNAATVDPRGLSYTDAITGVQQALYTPNLWPLLVKGLVELRAGHGDSLLKLADVYDSRNADGTYTNEQAAFNSVMCVDGPAMNNQNVVDQLDIKSREVAPFTDDGKGTGHASLDLCSYWPVRPTSWPHKLDGAALRARGLPHLVVVSTTDDPATPYQQGVDVADALGASLITYKGNQHTASFSTPASPCVDDAVSNYLLNLTPPPGGSTYTVLQGDTLSTIAAKLGVSDWQDLYQKNVEIVGHDPNLIRPGKVLSFGMSSGLTCAPAPRATPQTTSN